VARSKLTVAEYADTWIETQEGRLRPNTLRRYTENLGHRVLPRLGRPKLSSITGEAVIPPLDRQTVGRLIAATPEKYRALLAVTALLGCPAVRGARAPLKRHRPHHRSYPRSGTA
jgi:hypothetical protein